jgi:hypothetical protein
MEKVIGFDRPYSDPFKRLLNMPPTLVCIVVTPSSEVFREFSHVGDFAAFLFIFSPAFLQKQFTTQGWYKYKGISVGISVAGDLGQPDPDIAGDFGQPIPCCHRSIKMESARRGWNGHSQQESEAKLI